MALGRHGFGFGGCRVVFGGMQLGYQELELVCTFMSPICLGVVGGWKGNG